ncbi:MAG: hypothetical protein ACLUJR_15650 [Mediterraneibacter gnavus]
MIVETLFCTGTDDVARYRSLGTKGIAEPIAKAIDSRASACSEQKNNQNTENRTGREEEMKCLFTVEGKGAVYYFDGQKVITLGHPDELKSSSRFTRTTMVRTCRVTSGVLKRHGMQGSCRYLQ